MNHPARFLTFEGGEGAGKTTLINSLSTALQKKGYSVVVTREPGATPLGEKIRQLLLEHSSVFPISSNAELLLFLSDRAQHIDEVIKPALAKDKIVLCDRFNDSTIAYQGIARGLGLENVQTLCHQVCGKVQPDLTFFLDVDPLIGLNRAKNRRRTLDRLEQEQMDFHLKVREGFLLLAEHDKERIKILNAGLSEEEVFKAAIDLLESHL